jgi:hypothetical protein
MSLQFLPLKIGSVDTAFSEANSMVLDFSFPTPCTTVHAVLQGFDLLYDDPDHELLKIGVSLDVHFGSGDRSGTVQLSFVLKDDSSGIFSSNLIRGQIALLLIGL